MDGDFQQTYQAAERAYGGGDYETAHQLASDLLKQLESQDQSDDDQVRDAVLGWRAFVTLLLGHIELHGLQRPDQAAVFYQRALDCKPQNTLADLARQGLQRSLGEPKADQAGSVPSLLQDPFLNNATPASTSGPSQSTAMPWLKELSSPPQTKETFVPEPQRAEEPDEAVRSISDPSAPVVTAEEEPRTKKQPLPLLIPEESLQNAWLRVSITPNKTRDDSIPMDQAKPSSKLKRLWKGLSRS